MSKQVKLTRRRVLGILITIGLAGAAMGVGTFALFSDQETSSNNQISAGTLDLVGAADANLTASDIAPGDPVPTDGNPAWINATYTSESSIDPIAVDFSTSLSENDSSLTDPHGVNVNATEFGSQLTVESAVLYKNGAQQRDLVTADGVSTVADLDGLTVSDAFGNVSPGDRLSLELNVTFDSAAGNDYQADGVDIEATFNGTQ